MRTNKYLEALKAIADKPGKKVTLVELLHLKKIRKKVVKKINLIVLKMIKVRLLLVQKLLRN